MTVLVTVVIASPPPLVSMLFAARLEIAALLDEADCIPMTCRVELVGMPCPLEGDADVISPSEASSTGSAPPEGPS